MVVEAACADCGDVHPLGDRPRDWTTTRCPACGSTSYDSESSPNITKSEAERIADAVQDVDGIGPTTLANIQRRFGTFVALGAASRTALLAIDGVGPNAATGIRNALSPFEFDTTSE